MSLDPILRFGASRADDVEETLVPRQPRGKSEITANAAASVFRVKTFTVSPVSELL